MLAYWNDATELPDQGYFAILKHGFSITVETPYVKIGK